MLKINYATRAGGKLASLSIDRSKIRGGVDEIRKQSFDRRRFRSQSATARVNQGEISGLSEAFRCFDADLSFAKAAKM